MIIVSAYKPFQPENSLHQSLEGHFDWCEALKMLSHSAKVKSNLPVFALTDMEAKIPIPCFRFETKEQQLMLWILEVSLQYLKSDHFSKDTWFISPDMLIMKDIRGLKTSCDIGLLARDHAEVKKHILNGVQFWPHHAKNKIVALYEEFYQRAQQLPPDIKQWGADTLPLIEFASPVEVKGLHVRRGLRVRFYNHDKLCKRISVNYITRDFMQPIADFTYKRKFHMKQFFEARFA